MTPLAVRPAEPRLAVARAMEGIRQSPLREVMGMIRRPGVLSFAHGMPAAEMLPAEMLARGAGEILPAEPRHLQYGLPLAELREQVVELMRRRGVACTAEQVFLTTGAQQGLSLLSHLLLDPGGDVLLEETVYDGMQMAMLPMRPRLHTVPSDLHRGIDVDAVEALLQHGVRPAFLYVVTEGHNPLGVSLSWESRQRLASLAKSYGVPIVEDDAYGFLTYEEDGEALPPIKAIEARWVFYVGSFSKILAPALRVGWLVVPEELIPLLTALKHGSDVDTCTFSQALVSRFLDSGSLPLHLHRLRSTYRARRDAMLAALDRHLFGASRWNRPTAGMFVWLELPRPVDLVALLRSAVEQDGVAFSPGIAFTVGASEQADRTLRLSFVTLAPEQIEEGVRRLARALSRVA